MDMQQQLTSLKELFMLFEDPKDKFVQLMDMAKESEQLKENEKVEQNKINGCTSRAWVVTEQNSDDTFTFRADSDSLIVKGLLTILEKVYSGQTADNILSINSSDILYSIGLDKTITSQRTNGFSSAVQKIHNSLK
tara:strand:- start:10889 stop:11296 length:408 start_codon:yes stop_codon:yes gene_type:complete